LLPEGSFKEAKMRYVTYIIPASLIIQARNFFRTGRLEFRERMAFVTGIKLSPEIIVLTQLIKVKPKRTSAVGAEPDTLDLQKKHQAVLEMGMDLEAQWHSHPGKVPQSTYPSLTDIATVRRWEKAAPFIGAVFSEGGRYVRFFNHTQESSIQIYGSGVVRVSKSLFEIPEGDRDRSESQDTQAPERGTDGQAGEAGMVEPGQGQQLKSIFDWRRWLRWPHLKNLSAGWL
jgi:hypothetical protein